MKVRPLENEVAFVRRYGGSGAYDPVRDLVLDASDNCLFTGYSISPDLPVVGVESSALMGGSDGFLAVLDPQGEALLFSTYLGGEGSERVSALTLSGSSAVVAGSTWGTAFPFPVQVVGRQDWDDAFVSRIRYLGGEPKHARGF